MFFHGSGWSWRLREHKVIDLWVYRFLTALVTPLEWKKSSGSFTLSTAERILRTTLISVYMFSNLKYQP
jgi:hypothetical protein